MVFQWREAPAVGDNAIDEQHRELIGRFGDLLEACRRGQGKEKVAEVFGFLDTYVDFHSRAEEKLMAEHGYPGLFEHRSQHGWLVGRLAKLKSTLEQEGPSFSLLIDATQTLLEWIIDHIRNTDVQFGNFLRS